MVRRKGERTDKHRNLSHPFQVEIAQGAGPIAFDIMYRWASQHSHVTTQPKAPGQRVATVMRWCFCSREVADAFAQDFGGIRVDLPVEPRYLAKDEPDVRELERRAMGATIGALGRLIPALKGC